MRPQIINNNLNSNGNHIYKTEQQKETSELYYIKKNSSTTSTTSIGSSSSIINSNMTSNQNHQRPVTATPNKASPVNSANILKANNLQNSQLDSLLDSKKAREAFFERLRNTETQNINKNARLNSTPTVSAKENSKPNIDLEKPPTVTQHINKMLTISMNNNINAKPPIPNSHKTDEENGNQIGSKTLMANKETNALSTELNAAFNNAAKPFDIKNNFSNVVKIDMKFKSESVEKIETSDGQKNLGFLSSNIENNEDYNKHKLNLTSLVPTTNNNQELASKVSSEQNQQVSLQVRKNSQELEKAFMRDNLKNLFIRRNSLNGSEIKKKVSDNQAETNEGQIPKPNEEVIVGKVKSKGNIFF